jgi:uncharacterized protein
VVASGDLGDRIRGVLRQEPAITLAYLFGSVARGEATLGSDVDVALLAAAPLELMRLGSLQERLVLALGRPVDVLDLHVASPLLARDVVLEGIPLYVGDPGLKLDFELATIRRWEDSRRMRSEQQQLLRERAQLGRKD